MKNSLENFILKRHMQRIISFAKVAIVLVILCFITGCFHTRITITSDVKDSGAKVKTRYKYYYVGPKQSSYSAWLSGSDESAYAYLSTQTSLQYPPTFWLDPSDLLFQHQDLEQMQPDVFARNGIPITVTAVEHRKHDNDTNALVFFATFLLFWGSAWTFPGIDCYNIDFFSFNICCMNDIKNRERLEIVTQYDNATSLLSPLAILFFNSDTKIKGFEDKRTFSNDALSNDAKNIYSNILLECLAHAIASKLKEMEDTGIINDDIAVSSKRAWMTRNANVVSKYNIRQRQQALPSRMPVPLGQSSQQKLQSAERQQATYSLESLIWDKEKDFECLFTVKMKGECSIEAFFDVQRKFEANLRDAYVKMHPGVNPDSLVVDVKPSLDNGLISGHASVLTIAPTSLSYNPNTRRGKLSVRFNPGQAEAARTWIRRNIETLVRDKNIALITGKLPPEATYYSLGEKIEDNVMEIEFKTE